MTLKLRAKANSRLGTLEALATGNFPSSNFWTLSIYSTGRTMKNNMSIPKFARLNVSSDHGLSWATKEVAAEAKIPSKTHLTWSFWRHHSEFSEEKETLWVEHPWLEFRKKRGISPEASRKGTVVFVSHSVPGITPAISEIEKLIEHVETQDRFQGPYAYCLHMHDVNVGLHQEFLSRGRAVVTAGSSTSPYFIDRLYKILSHHENAVSFTPGTQVLLAQEFGLNSFISPLPNEPKLGRVKPSHSGEIDEMLLDQFIVDFSQIESIGSGKEARDKWLFLGLGSLEHSFETLTGGLKPLSWSRAREELFSAR